MNALMTSERLIKLMTNDAPVACTGKSLTNEMYMIKKAPLICRLNKVLNTIQVQHLATLEGMRWSGGYMAILVRVCKRCAKPVTGELVKPVANAYHCLIELYTVLRFLWIIESNVENFIEYYDADYMPN